MLSQLSGWKIRLLNQQKSRKHPLNCQRAPKILRSQSSRRKIRPLNQQKLNKKRLLHQQKSKKHPLNFENGLAFLHVVTVSRHSPFSFNMFEFNRMRDGETSKPASQYKEVVSRWRVEAWMQQDCRIRYRDIAARMRTIEPLYLRCISLPRPLQLRWKIEAKAADGGFW